MKICCISDTHSKHNEVVIPDDIDLIVHAGDISRRGTVEEVASFLFWFDSLKCRTNTKIFIAGNHDWLFQKNPTLAQTMINNTNSVVYLQDELVEVNGIKIWGSPFTPNFYDWAFNFNADPHTGRKQAEELWSKVPLTDVLITHGPLKGVGDRTADGRSAGCPVLYEKVMKVIRPKLHVCGHIHEDYSYNELDGGRIISVNASVLNRQYQYTNLPVVVEI